MRAKHDSAPRNCSGLSASESSLLSRQVQLAWWRRGGRTPPCLCVVLPRPTTWLSLDMPWAAADGPSAWQGPATSMGG